MKSKNIWLRALCVFLSIAIMSNSLARHHLIENHVQQGTAQVTEPIQSEQAQAIQAAERDAEAHTSKAAWFLFGCSRCWYTFPVFL